nr:hypothetical protein [Tanacetum cinerariifolium]
MPSMMTTQSVGRPAAASRGGGMGGRAGRGDGRTRGHFGDQGDGRNNGSGGQVGGQGSEVNGGVDGVPDFSTIIAQQLQNLLLTIVAQVGDQGRGQGNGRNQNDDAVNDHIRGDVGNASEGDDRRGCIYKEFLAYNPKEYDATEPKTIQKVVQIAGALTNEALRNGTIKNNPEKRGNEGEHSKDKDGREDNKRTKTGNAFASLANPVRGGYMGTTPKCTTYGYHHLHETPRRSCFNCNRLGHFAKDYRVAPRNVNPINARNPVARTCFECGSTDHIKSVCPRINQAQRLVANQQNQVVAVNEGQGRGNQGNQARGRAFIFGVEEARQDPNIVIGTFSSEIKIASGQLVEIDKVIRGCKLEIEGHVFDINLIPFGSGSFDVIIRMDWLSDHKAEIICHEKVVRIPLLDGKVLIVLRERPEEKMRQLMSAKSKEKKQEEIVVARDFPELFPDDLFDNLIISIT